MPVYIPSKKQNPKQEPAYRPPPSYENPISSYYDNAQDSVVNTALAFDEDTGGGLLLAKPPRRRKKRNRKKIKYLQYERLNTGKVNNVEGIKGNLKVINGSTKKQWDTVENIKYVSLPPGNYICRFSEFGTQSNSLYKSINVIRPYLNNKNALGPLLQKKIEELGRTRVHLHGSGGDPSYLLGCIGVKYNNGFNKRDEPMLEIAYELYRTSDWKTVKCKKIKLLIKE